MERIVTIILIIIVFAQCNNVKMVYNIGHDSKTLQNDTAKNINENSADTVKVIESNKSIIKIEKNDTVLSSSEKVTSIFLRRDNDTTITIIKEKDSTILKSPAGNKFKSILNDCDCDDVVARNKIPWCNHKFEFRGVIFSDFVGVKDDQPNGLIQNKFLFILHKANQNNRKKIFKKRFN
ncbi:MAG: hypothetical protein HC831_06995 [Chloroflexia bacterium]|nr:hypothetical protein [Chloroflexia bacterium]